MEVLPTKLTGGLLMGTTKLITMYGSPWSERVRWAFAFKRLPYEKQNYQPGVDEDNDVRPESDEPPPEAGGV